MDLIFENDEQRSKLIRGYLKNWDFSKNNGSYNSGKDFFSVHWELHFDSPSVVRLDVEAPTKAIDYELNYLKQRIIIAILSKTLDIKNSVTLGDLQIAGRLFNTDLYKSSEVFHIKIFDHNIKPDHTDNIRQIHNEIGVIISKVISKFSDEFKRHGF